MVQALLRGMEILQIVSSCENGIRLYELAEKMGLKRTTVFNLAKTLIDGGYLKKGDGAVYELGPELFALCARRESSQDRRRMAAKMLEFHQSHPDTVLFYTELGTHDVNARIYISRGRDAAPQFPADVTLSPYLTVCGMIFFAYAPDEQLNGIRLRHPFAFEGSECWQSGENFSRALELTRKNGYAESPATPPGELKFGLPVFGRSGMLRGALTVSWHNYTERDEADIRRKLGEVRRFVETIKE